jgi:hypothetical protein
MSLRNTLARHKSWTSANVEQKPSFFRRAADGAHFCRMLGMELALCSARLDHHPAPRSRLRRPHVRSQFICAFELVAASRARPSSSGPHLRPSYRPVAQSSAKRLMKNKIPRAMGRADAAPHAARAGAISRVIATTWAPTWGAPHPLRTGHGQGLMVSIPSSIADGSFDHA